MTPPRAHGWAISFADLALLLLGCFVILYSSRPEGAVRAAPRAAVVAEAPSLDMLSASLFEEGEARLTPEARARLTALGGRAAGGRDRVSVVSVGRAAASRRFDGWELAAARTAAVARAIGEGGVAEDRIELTMAGGRAEGGHRIRVRIGG